MELLHSYLMDFSIDRSEFSSRMEDLLQEMRTYKIDKNESTLKNERKTKLKHEINIYIEIKRKEGSDMDRIPAAKALMQCIDTPSQNNIQELNLYREQFDQATRLKDLYFQAIDDNLIENELNLERPRSGCSLF